MLLRWLVVTLFCVIPLESVLRYSALFCVILRYSVMHQSALDCAILRYSVRIRSALFCVILRYTCCRLSSSEIEMQSRWGSSGPVTSSTARTFLGNIMRKQAVLTHWWTVTKENGHESGMHRIC